MNQPVERERRRLLTTSAGTHAGAFMSLDWALFAAIGAIWGSSFLFIRVGLDAFAPGLVTFVRIVFGAAMLWLVPAARQPVGREDRSRVILISVLWVAIPFTLFPLAEQHIASGLTGLINGALPIFAGTIGASMLRRLPARLQVLGLAVGFVGIAAIAVPTIGEGSSEALGVLFALLGVACYGVAINVAAPVTQRYGALPTMARMLAWASLWTAPFGLVGFARSTFAWPSFAAVLALGVLGTGIAFVLMGRLVARVGSTRASTATYLIPVVALVLGAVFLDEQVHPLSIVGIVLVIAGAVLASRRERAA